MLHAILAGKINESGVFKDVDSSFLGGDWGFSVSPKRGARNNFFFQKKGFRLFFLKKIHSFRVQV